MQKHEHPALEQILELRAERRKNFGAHRRSPRNDLALDRKVSGAGTRELEVDRGVPLVLAFPVLADHSDRLPDRALGTLRDPAGPRDYAIDNVERQILVEAARPAVAARLRARAEPLARPAVRQHAPHVRLLHERLERAAIGGFSLPLLATLGPKPRKLLLRRRRKALSPAAERAGRDLEPRRKRLRAPGRAQGHRQGRSALYSTLLPARQATLTPFP